jgi:predicted DNA-binding transcriptional regulator AlpA
MLHLISTRSGANMNDQPALTADAVRAASLLGVSERTFHNLRKRADFPRAVALLSNSRPRWRTADLEAWVKALPLIEAEAQEPQRLFEGRYRAQRGTR